MNHHVLSEGILSAAMTPLRGEAIGWTLLFAVWSPWLVLVQRAFLPMPILGLLVLLGTGSVYITACMAYFGACMRGVRAGQLEPQVSELREHATAWSVFLPGFSLLALLVVLCFPVSALLWWLAGGIVDWHTHLVGWVLVAVISGWLLLATAVYHGRRSLLGLVHVPAQVRVLIGSGAAFVVPLGLAFVAGVGPIRLVEVGNDLGWTADVAVQSVAHVMSGFAWGAMGASMGWLANRSERVAAALDG